MTKQVLVFEVSGIHETAQEEMAHNKNGSPPGLGWPLSPFAWDLSVFWN